MTKLHPIEFQIIRSLLVKEFGPNTPFLEQLGSVNINTRRMTGTGYYVDLSVPKKARRADKVNADPTVAYKTSLAPPCDLVGFTLLIHDGYLSSFEGYTFGDVRWPGEPIEEWLIFDAT